MTRSAPSALLMTSSPLVQDNTGPLTVLSLPKASAGGDGYLSAEDFVRIPAIESRLATCVTSSHLWPQSNIKGLQADLAERSFVGHTHQISDIKVLDQILALKADVGHVQDIDSISGLTGRLTALHAICKGKMFIVPAARNDNLATFANGQVVDAGLSLSDLAKVEHTHSLVNIDGLESTLAGLSALEHVHTLNEITGLTERLTDIYSKIGERASLVHDGKAGHLVTLTQRGDIQGSGYTVDSFALAVHEHDIDSVQGLSSALDQKLNVNGSISIEQVGGLADLLKSKHSVGSKVSISQVIGLQPVLDSLTNQQVIIPMTAAADLPLGVLGQLLVIKDIGEHGCIAFYNGKNWINLTSGLPISS